MRKSIIKIQISLASSDGTASVLVYNKSRSYMCEGEAFPELIKLMKGEPKKYFYAKIPKNLLKSEDFELLEEAPNQDW